MLVRGAGRVIRAAVERAAARHKGGCVKRVGGLMRLAGGLMLACALLAGCGGASTPRQASPPAGTPGAASSPSPDAPASPSPAGTPSATATTAPLVMLTGATLGGTRNGFAAKYGAPAVPDHWNVNGLTFSLSVATGIDAQPHVTRIEARKSDGRSWTQTQAQAVCAAFLPPDALHQRDTTTPSGDPEAIYYSGHLGSTFLPSAFGDAPSGTLAIDFAASGGGIAQCAIAVGTV